MGKHNAYPEEVIEFIRENVSGKTAEELAILCNERFGTNFNKNTMKNFKQNHKIRSGKEHLKGPKTETALFPKEVFEFIMENYKGTGHSKMAKLLNEKFGTEYTALQIKAFYGSRKLDSGITGYFESGHVPVNKLPIGSVLKKSDGYLWRKIGEGSRDWKQEHILRWEEANGPIPKGFLITFLDGDRENVKLSNLALISKAEHIAMVRMKLRSEEPEITETGILIARLYSEKQKRKKGKKDG